MKKYLALLVGVIMLLSFAACGTSEKDEATEGTIVLNINTDGMGQIAYAHKGEKLTFDDEYPIQSVQQDLTEPATYVLSAKPDEDWKFVKWTKDGEDYSTDEEITVDVDASVEYIAYFSTSE